jgi:hypothetical protein
MFEMAGDTAQAVRAAHSDMTPARRQAGGVRSRWPGIGRRPAGRLEIKSFQSSIDHLHPAIAVSGGVGEYKAAIASAVGARSISRTLLMTVRGSHGEA